MRSSRLVLGAAALTTGALAARRPLMNWGSTCEERERPLPGDGLIEGERGTSTMATTIAAPPAAIWPWLAQMGTDRAGWYSWDRLDNGGDPSADTINPEWQHVAAGDRMETVPGRSWFEVVHVVPNRSLVLRAALDLRGVPFDAAGMRPRWCSESRWEFFLDPKPDGTTRLLVRTGGVATPRRLSDIVNWAFWNPVHVVMQVRQFGQLRTRAEGLVGHVGAGELRQEVSAGVA